MATKEQELSVLRDHMLMHLPEGLVDFVFNPTVQIDLDPKRTTTEIYLNGRKLCFSYRELVVVHNSEGWWYTTEKFSRTTSRHVNQFIGSVGKPTDDIWSKVWD